MHRYTLSNSDVIFTVWQCKQGYLSNGSCVFVKAYSRFEEDCISKISSYLTRVGPMMRCVSQKQNSFCGFSTSDVGLNLVQSGVRVARQKQLKVCGISLKKLAVEPITLSLKTAHVIVHVTCKLITSRT